MAKRRTIRVAAGIAVGLMAAAVLPSVTVYERTRRTCVLCRADLREKSLLGYTWERESDTDFTPWYRAHRPPHDHMWKRASCTRGCNIFGGVTYYACGPQHPVSKIPPVAMEEFTARVDGAALARFFDDVLSEDREAQERAVAYVLGEASER
jgi:hypothetical protein